MSQPLHYGQYRRSLSRWLPQFVGAESATDFLRRFGTKSGRVGGATTAANAGIDKTDWVRHGGWANSDGACNRYIQPDHAKLQVVGRAIMSPNPTTSGTSQPPHNLGSSALLPFLV